MTNQKIKKLKKVGTAGKATNDQAIIYGNFIQRLGFTSGGYPQDIRLFNLNTKEILSFRVKRTFRSTKENRFLYFIEPGQYLILNYWWTQSKWYGGRIFTEPIYKGIDSSKDLDKRIKSGEIRTTDLRQFSFEINRKPLFYLGTWHFDQGLVSFSNDKSRLDSILKGKYSKIDFSSATTELPK